MFAVRDGFARAYWLEVMEFVLLVFVRRSQQTALATTVVKIPAGIFALVRPIAGFVVIWVIRGPANRCTCTPRPFEDVQGLLLCAGKHIVAVTGEKLRTERVAVAVAFVTDKRGAVVCVQGAKVRTRVRVGSVRSSKLAVPMFRVVDAIFQLGVQPCVPITNVPGWRDEVRSTS